MPVIDSDDYHDFVIKDGKLVGEFEQMYRKSREIPWHQDQQESALDVRITVELLRAESPFDYICDLGCGLGYFLDILGRKIGASDCRLIGLDLSPTCCERAKKLFPAARFETLDLMAGHTSLSLRKLLHAEGPNSKQTRQRRLFAIRGTLWYVFPAMATVVKNIAATARSGDVLLVSQNFPPLASGFVGKDVIPDPAALIAWFTGHFRPTRTIWMEDKVSEGNDNWFIAKFIREG